MCAAAANRVAAWANRGEMSAVGGLVRGERRGRWLVVAAACAVAAALAAAPARAAEGFINGTPLKVYANDNGQLQVAFAGSATGEFFPPALAPANAGFVLAYTSATNPGPFEVHGFLGTPFRTDGFGDAPPQISGDGSAANPWVLTTTYHSGTTLGADLSAQVTETLTYVNGSTDVTATYVVTNQNDSPTPLLVRAYQVADLYVAGNDAGVGYFDPGPPRQLGGINDAAGSSGRLVESTPWSAFQEGQYNDVFAVAGNTSQPGFSNATDPTLLDNGAGVQWNVAALPQLGSQTFQVVWRFRRFTPLVLTLASATQTTGQQATVTVTARNSEGNADVGRSVRYAIEGANPSGGAVTTAADGSAAIRWTGVNAGVDNLTAFIDLNNNGLRDGAEAQQATTVTWTQAPPPPPPAPPVPGKSVVVKVVSGQVFIKLPGSGRARATGPAKGFVPFTGAANIPVGSQLDTKKGRVALTSAADTAGVKTQTSDFYQGIFQVKQAVPKKKPKKPAALTTDLVMKGQIARSQCAPLKGARAAAVSAKKKKKGPKAVLGKLWGNGKGKFRTNGKYSSATVRGTIWLVEDRCEGTLTKVTRGTVRVRDLRRKKTVTVKAGHSYLARAQRAASKAKRR
jgi:hypothetical protein